MSYLDTRQALLIKLITSGIVPSADIAYENKSFNPSGKDIWVSVHFIPATDDIMGKNTESRNEQRGIFQISIFVKKNADNYDLEQLIKIDQILNEFSYNSQASSNDQVVDILESNISEGSISESWFQRDISINYLTFSTR